MAEARAGIGRLRPAIAILDDGLGVAMGSLTADLRARRSSLRVLVVADEVDVGDVLACLRAGVAGYLLREDLTPFTIATYLEALQPGDVVLLSRELALAVLRSDADRQAPASGAARSRGVRAISGRGGMALSGREQEVVTHFAGGASVKEIHKALAISVKTVHSHLQHAGAKLGAQNRTQLGMLLRRPGPQGGWRDT